VAENDNNDTPTDSGNSDDEEDRITTTAKSQLQAGKEEEEEGGNSENATERKEEDADGERGNVSLRRTDAQEETSEDPELLAALREIAGTTFDLNFEFAPAPLFFLPEIPLTLNTGCFSPSLNMLFYFFVGKCMSLFVSPSSLTWATKFLFLSTVHVLFLT
jgi:hypothetical protein